MPKVSEQHREARRDQILDAALRAFGSKGFHRSSMADIIAEAGLSAGAIYLHFESKEELSLAVAQRILGRRVSELGLRLDSGELPPPSEMLRMMMTGLTGDIGDPRLLVQLWGEAVTDPRFSALLGPIFAEVRGVLEPYLIRWAAGARGLDADAAVAWAGAVVPVFVGMAQGYILQSALLPGFRGEDYLRGVADLLDGPAT